MLYRFVPESSGQKFLFSDTLRCFLCCKAEMLTVSDSFLAEFCKNASNLGEEWLFPGLGLPMIIIIKRKKIELSIFP